MVQFALELDKIRPSRLLFQSRGPDLMNFFEQVEFLIHIGLNNGMNKFEAFDFALNFLGVKP